MEINDLQALKVKELQKLANDIGATEFSGMRKQELIKLILEIQAETN